MPINLNIVFFSTCSAYPCVSFCISMTTSHPGGKKNLYLKEKKQSYVSYLHTLKLAIP